jgi:hypothetical protein
MNVKLLVMDESECPETDIVGLTGVMIPVEKAGTIRDDLYRFLRGLQALPPNHFHPLPELHGRSMFKDESWASDDHRIFAYEHVVDAVNHHGLDVLRVAYREHRKLRGVFKGDPKLHGLCFLGLSISMARFLPDAYVLPIMDGLDEKLAPMFGGLVKNGAAMLASGMAPEDISIYRSENLLDPVFASSRFCTAVQIADVVSYLLHVRDFEATGRPISPFKSRILDAAKRLDPTLVAGAEPLTLTIHDG